RAEEIDWPQRVVLDMDSTEIPVYGEQEQSAYNGHFESTCYHPLLLFNREGDCLAAKLRPGNVHSGEEGEGLLLPEIARQQKPWFVLTCALEGTGSALILRPKRGRAERMSGGDREAPACRGR